MNERGREGSDGRHVKAATLPHGPVRCDLPFFTQGDDAGCPAAPHHRLAEEAPVSEAPVGEGSVRDALRARLMVVTFSLVASSAVTVALRALIGSSG